MFSSEQTIDDTNYIRDALQSGGTIDQLIEEMIKEQSLLQAHQNIENSLDNAGLNNTLEHKICRDDLLCELRRDDCEVDSDDCEADNDNYEADSVNCEADDPQSDNLNNHDKALWYIGYTLLTFLPKLTFTTDLQEHLFCYTLGWYVQMNRQINNSMQPIDRKDFTQKNSQ